MNRFYARHIPSGEVYAIEATVDRVTGFAGALHYSEVKDVDDHDYDTDTEGCDWIQQQLGVGHFAMVTPREINPEVV